MYAEGEPPMQMPDGSVEVLMQNVAKHIPNCMIMFRSATAYADQIQLVVEGELSKAMASQYGTLPILDDVPILVIEASEDYVQGTLPYVIL